MKIYRKEFVCDLKRYTASMKCGRISRKRTYLKKDTIVKYDDVCIGF